MKNNAFFFPFVVLSAALWLWRKRPTPCRKTPLTLCPRRTGWRRPARETLCWDPPGRPRWKTASCNPEKNRAPSGISAFFQDLPEKGNVTKLECSITETEKAIFVVTLSTQSHSFSLSVTLSTSDTTKCQEMQGMVLHSNWKPDPI